MLKIYGCYFRIIIKITISLISSGVLWIMRNVERGAAFDYGYRMISKRNENLWEASTSVFSKEVRCSHRVKTILPGIMKKGG